MKVLSVKLDGSALVEFENLERHTDVVGVMAPIRAEVSISSIPDLIRIGQKARRRGQQICANFTRMQKYYERHDQK